MEHKVLVLTNWYFPYQILSWQDAVRLVYVGSAIVVAEYDDVIRSPSVTWKIPAVIVLEKTIKLKRRVRFSRFNIFSRDKFCCQYCGKKKAMRELTFDHVIPRKDGGKTRWDNIVTACKECNSIKGCRTVTEANMRPMNAPKKPKTLPLVSPVRAIKSVPIEWHDFLSPHLKEC